MDNQAKTAWVERSKSTEQDFVNVYGKELGLTINPAKDRDPYVPDLMWRGRRLAELKARSTPFFQAGRYYGIPPQYAVTINLKDIRHYTENYPGLLIYFWVFWAPPYEKHEVRVEPMSGVWGIRLENLVPLCTDDRLHAYMERRNDTKGNAKDSYVVSLEEMKCLIRDELNIPPRLSTGHDT